MSRPADVPALSPPGLPARRRRFDRRALVVVLAVHCLLIYAVLERRAPAPAAPPAALREATVVVALPKPAPEPRPEPAAAGVKLATRPSPGLPTRTTRERALATMPTVDVDSSLQVAAVADPLPNLASIDVAASSIGSGGTGNRGAGAAAAGTGTGSGRPGRLFEECAETPDRPMVAAVYRLPDNTTSLDRMAGRKPLKNVCMAQLNITPRHFREGFPGLDGLVEWFGLDIRFTVNVPEAGNRDVLLIADDGAILTIDGVEVIDNDGVHAAQPSTAQVRLAAGARQFRIRYFQGPREGVALMLAWKRPDEAEFDYIPAKLISRPAQ